LRHSKTTDVAISTVVVVKNGFDRGCVFCSRICILDKKQQMKFLSLEPFVPSGSNFEGSREFFQELGFHINWEVDGYIGFQRD
jgi:hypothetical protein